MAFQHDDRRGGSTVVGDRQVRPADAELLRAPLRGTVERELRRTRGVAHHLDLSEAETRRPASAERLERRLLGGEQTTEVGDARGITAPPAAFAGAADAIHEAVAVTREDGAEPLEVDEVEADADDRAHDGTVPWSTVSTSAVALSGEAKARIAATP